MQAFTSKYNKMCVSGDGISEGEGMGKKKGRKQEGRLFIDQVLVWMACEEKNERLLEVRRRQE